MISLGDVPSLPATLTVEQTAELLGIGRQSAYQAVRTGTIPSVRVGRLIRVPTGKVLEMLGLPPPATERERAGGQPDSLDADAEDVTPTVADNATNLQSLSRRRRDRTGTSRRTELA